MMPIANEALMAFVALGTFFSGASVSVITWPGVAVAAAGLLVTTLAQAFYYHFGAWGAKETAGKSADELNAYVDSLRVATHYVTFWVRFSRVFFGLDILVLALGLGHPVRKVQRWAAPFLMRKASRRPEQPDGVRKRVCCVRNHSQNTFFPVKVSGLGRLDMKP